MVDSTQSIPSVGMCTWLMEGGRMVDRIKWLAKKGFGGVSLLQSAMELDEREREDAAAAIKEERLWVTYHGNVQTNLTASRELNIDFGNRLIDDVLWWHENAGGVCACCSDSIHVPQNDGRSHFIFELNRKHMLQISTGLSKYDIPVGIENNCGGTERFCASEDIRNFLEKCSDISLGMLLDAGHANIHVRSDGNGKQHNCDIGSYVELLPCKLLEIHFSDNMGIDDEHKYLGYGNLDLQSLFRTLKKLRFSGKLTLEVCPDLATGIKTDIRNPNQTDLLLISRDKITEWAVGIENSLHI